jgi:hypothetical protein
MLHTYIRSGGLIATALILYFLMMKLLGLHEYPALSAFNGLIFAWGIYRVMRQQKQQSNTFNYGQVWQAGFFSGAAATLFFTVFMAFYMYQINSDFANNVLSNWGIAYNNGVVTMLISIVLMGLGSAVVLALTFMQRLKEPAFPGKASAPTRTNE